MDGRQAQAGLQLLQCRLIQLHCPLETIPAIDKAVGNGIDPNPVFAQKAEYFLRCQTVRGKITDLLSRNAANGPFQYGGSLRFCSDVPRFSECRGLRLAAFFLMKNGEPL